MKQELQDNLKNFVDVHHDASGELKQKDDLKF